VRSVITDSNQKRLLNTGRLSSLLSEWELTIVYFKTDLDNLSDERIRQFAMLSLWWASDRDVKIFNEQLGLLRES
jgi:hypothetical protein